MLTKKRAILLAIIVALFIIVPIMSCSKRNNGVQAEEMQAITLWQIDGFEGGKGSRAQYLADKWAKLFDGKQKYLNVLSLNEDSAKANIENGVLPDMISYAPTFNAHLNYINSTEFAYKTWCYGSYFILTLQDSAQFTDIQASNTVINRGKSNLYDVASVLYGINGAASESPTNAYLQLINGKYKYLFGTQRDIFRLKTRGVSFSIKQVTQFNDLYQNISILTTNAGKYATCKKFAEYIRKNNADINKLGLFSENAQNEGDELNGLGLTPFESELRSPCSADFISQLKSAAAVNDVNKIKNQLK